jgi:O-antigen ligase
VVGVHDVLNSYTYNSEVIYYIHTGKALGPKGFWTWLLGENGILGTVLFLLFLYSIVKKYLKIDSIHKTKQAKYLKYAFLIFLISFFFQGFNSAALFFIWQWALFGFFVGFTYYIKKRGQYDYIH